MGTQMDAIANNLKRVKDSLPDSVTLVAVSKFHPADAVMAAYRAGQRVFGESRQQELVQKQAALPKDIRWHFIGHLQTNKVRSVLPYVHTVESVDSVKLLREIEKQGQALALRTDCLLEIHIASEPQKYGFTMDACREFLSSGEWQDYRSLCITGVMGMASFTDDEAQVRAEFRSLKTFFDELKTRFFANDPSFRHVSMGMSGDYPVAVEEGSTMVRVGTSIFGEREY